MWCWMDELSHYREKMMEGTERSWLPDPDPAFPSANAVKACDMLAWHLRMANASDHLVEQVQQLSKDIRHELGPVS